MKRDFLKKLFADFDISEEQSKSVIEKIMSENGKDFQRINDLEEQNKDLSNQVEDYNKQLKDLKKSVGDNDALNQKIEELQNANKKQSEDYKAKIAQQKINSAVGFALRDAGARNPKILEGLIDKNKISFDDNGKTIGLKDQIESLKKDPSTSFGFKSVDTPTQPRVVATTGGNPSPATQEGKQIDLSKASYGEVLKFKHDNPEAYKEMVERSENTNE